MQIYHLNILMTLNSIRNLLIWTTVLFVPEKKMGSVITSLKLGSDIDLSGRRQAVIWASAGIM